MSVRGGWKSILLIPPKARINNNDDSTSSLPSTSMTSACRSTWRTLSARLKASCCSWRNTANCRSRWRRSWAWPRSPSPPPWRTQSSCRPPPGISTEVTPLQPSWRGAAEACHNPAPPARSWAARATNWSTHTQTPACSSTTRTIIVIYTRSWD